MSPEAWRAGSGRGRHAGVPNVAATRCIGAPGSSACVAWLWRSQCGLTLPPGPHAVRLSTPAAPPRFDASARRRFRDGNTGASSAAPSHNVIRPGIEVRFQRGAIGSRCVRRGRRRGEAGQAAAESYAASGSGCGPALDAVLRAAGGGCTVPRRLGRRGTRADALGRHGCARSAGVSG
jgi:hypothetical protein